MTLSIKKLRVCAVSRWRLLSSRPALLSEDVFFRSGLQASFDLYFLKRFHERKGNYPAFRCKQGIIFFNATASKNTPSSPFYHNHPDMIIQKIKLVWDDGVEISIDFKDSPKLNMISEKRWKGDDNYWFRILGFIPPERWTDISWGKKIDNCINVRDSIMPTKAGIQNFL